MVRDIQIMEAVYPAFFEVSIHISDKEYDYHHKDKISYLLFYIDFPQRSIS